MVFKMPTTRTVSEIRFPEIVWLVGKGPSMSRYIYSGFTIAINEAALLVPCDYAIAMDYRVFDNYEKRLNKPLITTKCSAESYKLPVDEVYIFDRFQFKYTMGTGTVAAQLLVSCGVKFINFIGFDSIDGISKNDNTIIKNKWKGDNNDKYKRINSELFSFLREKKVRFSWVHRFL